MGDKEEKHIDQVPSVKRLAPPTPSFLALFLASRSTVNQPHVQGYLPRHPPSMRHKLNIDLIKWPILLLVAALSNKLGINQW